MICINGKKLCIASKKHQKDLEKKYSVFVDNTEVNDYYLTLRQALELALGFEEENYDTIEILEKEE